MTSPNRKTNVNGVQLLENDDQFASYIRIVDLDNGEALFHNPEQDMYYVTSIRYPTDSNEVSHHEALDEMLKYGADMDSILQLLNGKVSRLTSRSNLKLAPDIVVGGIAAGILKTVTLELDPVAVTNLQDQEYLSEQLSELMNLLLSLNDLFKSVKVKTLPTYQNPRLVSGPK